MVVGSGEDWPVIGYELVVVVGHDSLMVLGKCEGQLVMSYKLIVGYVKSLMVVGSCEGWPVMVEFKVLLWFLAGN